MGNGQADVESGINLWNTANTTANFNYVQFYSGGTTARFFAYWNNYPGNPYSDPGAPGQVGIALYSGTDVIATITVTYYFNSTGSGNTVSLSQVDPGFDSMMTKTTLHEIGHSMGLGENYFGPAQQSVMNGWDGTNDINNSIATNVTSCDNASVHTFQ